LLLDMLAARLAAAKGQATASGDGGGGGGGAGAGAGGAATATTTAASGATQPAAGGATVQVPEKNLEPILQLKALSLDEDSALAFLNNALRIRGTVLLRIGAQLACVLVVSVIVVILHRLAGFGVAFTTVPSAHLLMGTLKLQCRRVAASVV
jgi:hypothetical protein